TGLCFCLTGFKAYLFLTKFTGLSGFVLPTPVLRAPTKNLANLVLPARKEKSCPSCKSCPKKKSCPSSKSCLKKEILSIL
ncbi:MAG: hypothetical protein KDC54_14630, partial [Lewinella sp.]|nr:hypothetical protein [Lewinella sp.]